MITSGWNSIAVLYLANSYEYWLGLFTNQPQIIGFIPFTIAIALCMTSHTELPFECILIFLFLQCHFSMRVVRVEICVLLSLPLQSDIPSQPPAVGGQMSPPGTFFMKIDACSLLTFCVTK